MKRVLWLDEVNKDSLPEVGGKNAGLGELLRAGMRVPPGFAVTTSSHVKFIDESGIRDRMLRILSEVKPDDTSSTNDASSRVRDLFEKNPMSEDVKEDLKEHYIRLCEKNNVSDMPVAVRSSATAEDLPGASFAGQQETYLNIELLGDVACISGNMPIDLLSVGTPQRIKDHAKKLIEIAGKGGGYIMMNGAVIDNAPPENLKAMIDFTREYGKY